MSQESEARSVQGSRFKVQSSRSQLQTSRFLDWRRLRDNLLAFTLEFWVHVFSLIHHHHRVCSVQLLAQVVTIKVNADVAALTLGKALQICGKFIDGRVRRMLFLEDGKWKADPDERLGCILLSLLQACSIIQIKIFFSSGKPTKYSLLISATMFQNTFPVRYTQSPMKCHENGHNQLRFN